MTDTHRTESPTFTELFVRAYHPESGSEFPPSDEMDRGFLFARRCLKRENILNRLNVLNEEVRTLTIDMLNLQMSKVQSESESEAENSRKRDVILKRMGELNDEIDRLVDEMRTV